MPRTHDSTTPVCRLCPATDPTELIRPSPGLGPVHRRCLIVQDAEDEARELEFASYRLLGAPYDTDSALSAA